MILNAQKIDDPAQEEDAPVKPLPLVVVYILGFDLPELKANEASILLRSAILGLQSQGFNQSAIVGMLNITPEKLTELLE